MAGPPADAPAPPPAGRSGGRKILGLSPAGWALTLGLALVAGGYLLYRRGKNRASSTAATATTSGCPAGYALDSAGNCQPVTGDTSGQIGTLQTEIMDLQSSEAQEGKPPGAGGSGTPAGSTAPPQDIQWVSTGLYSLNVVALSHRTSPEAIVDATQKHGSYGGIFESYVNKGNFNNKIPVGAIMWIPQYTPAPVAVYSGESYTSPGLSPGTPGSSSGTASPGSPAAEQGTGGAGKNKPPAIPKSGPAKPAAKPAPRKAPAHHTTKKKAA